jgi:protein farnesyltransferase subunit beta
MDINLKEMDLAENERGQALKLSSTL